jgi:hypothetical protein
MAGRKGGLESGARYPSHYNLKMGVRFIYGESQNASDSMRYEYVITGFGSSAHIFLFGNEQLCPLTLFTLPT